MKLYNPALKLIPGPKSTIDVWKRQYRPTIELYPKKPVSKTARVWRDFKGFLLFAGLFRQDKLLWLGSWLFHVSLSILFLLHLRWILPSSWFEAAWLRPLADVSGWVLMGSSVYLIIRRLLVARVRQITSFADYLSESLLAISVATGLWAAHEGVDPQVVSSYVRGLVTFTPVSPAFTGSMVSHLLSLQLLLLVMPFSHLLHSGGIFISRRFLASPDTFSGDVE